jgi:hypothetical protein
VTNIRVTCLGDADAGVVQKNLPISVVEIIEEEALDSRVSAALERCINSVMSVTVSCNAIGSKLVMCSANFEAGAYLCASGSRQFVGSGA